MTKQNNRMTLDLNFFEAELLYIALTTFRPVAKFDKRQKLRRDELVNQLHEFVMEGEL